MALPKGNLILSRISSLLNNIPEQAQFYAAIPTSAPGCAPTLMQTTRDSFINAVKFSCGEIGGEHTHCQYSWDDYALILHTAACLCCIVLNKNELTPLECELLAIVRSMSAKLYESADLWDMYVQNFPEPSAAMRTYADYSFYLKQFPQMEQFGYK